MYQTEAAVTMTVGQQYCCQNLECGCEIVVSKSSTEADANPRCCCGAEMKKPYSPPAVRKVDASDPRLIAFEDVLKAKR
jgi:hypothetical protein